MNELANQVLKTELIELQRLQEKRTKKLAKGRNLTPLINWRIWRASRRLRNIAEAARAT